LTVSVTAEDDRGVGFVEVSYGGQFVRLAARGQRTFNGLVPFQPGINPNNSVGAATGVVRAVAYATDGVTMGTPVTRRVTRGPDDVGPAATEQMLANYREMLGDAGYAERTGLLENIPGNPRLGSDGRPWWIQWQANGGPKHFDWKTKCGYNNLWDGGLPDVEGKVLNCWLNLNPHVAANIVWAELDPNEGPRDQYGVQMGVVSQLSYQNWTPAMQQDLYFAFFYAFEYLHKGTSWFNGTYLPPYPQNLNTVADNDWVVTDLSHSDAWNLYIGTIAHSLALEIGGFVPWSVVNYKASDLAVLFNSVTMYSAGYRQWTASPGQKKSAAGYFIDNMIPAPPTTTFEFLLSQNAVLPSQLWTIGGYLEWARAAMAHTAAYLDGQNNVILRDGNDGKSAQAYWGVRSATPASQLMKRTVFVDPDGYTYPPYAWVFGCIGVSYGTQAILRAVNIPVQPDHMPNLHTAPIFWTVGRALSHGDDVYGYGQHHATPDFPAHDILITTDTYNNWFYGPGMLGPAGVSNVSRQVDMELPLAWLPNDLLQAYCADQAANMSHANGAVAAYFRDPQHNVAVYTVPQLESLNLWQNLAQKANALGYCAP
jgi:hypothetical protein